jgi:hypothetical protein
MRLRDAPIDLFGVKLAVEALLDSAGPRIFAAGPDVAPSFGRHEDIVGQVDRPGASRKGAMA